MSHIMSDFFQFWFIHELCRNLTDSCSKGRYMTCKTWTLSLWNIIKFCTNGWFTYRMLKYFFAFILISWVLSLRLVFYFFIRFLSLKFGMDDFHLLNISNCYKLTLSIHQLLLYIFFHLTIALFKILHQHPWILNRLKLIFLHL